MVVVVGVDVFVAVDNDVDVYVVCFSLLYFIIVAIVVIFVVVVVVVVVVVLTGEIGPLWNKQERRSRLGNSYYFCCCFLFLLLLC